eukprot:scaffold2403_cov141-Isochrysis_galbana.AAC.2
MPYWQLSTIADLCRRPHRAPDATPVLVLIWRSTSTCDTRDLRSTVTAIPTDIKEPGRRRGHAFFYLPSEFFFTSFSGACGWLGEGVTLNRTGGPRGTDTRTQTSTQAQADEKRRTTRDKGHKNKMI